MFVAAKGQACLVGVTEQWMGLNSCEDDFRYGGSVGPLRLAPTMADAWQRIGAVLAAEFDLRGLFGVDAVLDEHDEILAD